MRVNLFFWGFGPCFLWYLQIGAPLEIIKRLGAFVNM